ncbi:beta strand repeat-containing protein, partial [Flavobacterium sp. UBA7682]|uniref:beta strand repeat-containing protein n=1 Tax=Flavobacterium sp. UBA7682 TaxID=1946560 RepID=UPI0025C2DAE7
MKTILQNSKIKTTVFFLMMLFFANESFAQVSILNNWTNVYNGTSNSGTPSYVVPTGTDSNRLLVVAIATTRTTAGSRSITLTYGGRSFTLANGDLATSNRQHTAIYYLKESDLDLASNTTLSYSISNGTTALNSVWVGVFDYVDQTTSITNTRVYNSGSAISDFQFSTNLTINAGDQAILLVNSCRVGSTSDRNFDNFNSFTSVNQQTGTFNTSGTSNDLGINGAIANYTTVPTSNTSSNCLVELSGTSLPSMTGVSIKGCALPTVNAGSALTAICKGGTSAPLGGSRGGSATGAIWSDGGVGGTFSPNATTLNAAWTPPSNYEGTATLTLTTTGGSCGTVSASKTQVVNPTPTSVIATESASTICSGDTVDLTASANSNSELTSVVRLNEDFNGTPVGWTTTNTSSGGNPALAAWTLRNDYTISSVNFKGIDNTQFYMSNSDAQGSGSTTDTALTSPSFSTVGLSSATLNFYHYYRDYNADDNADVQVSVNGTTWTTLSPSYTATVGSSTGFVLGTFDLSSYLNQATVFIRFKYHAEWGYYWAIDNVSVTGMSSTPPPATFAWTSTPSGFTSSLQNPTGVAPTVNTFYTVTATNSYGCSASSSTATIAVKNTWLGTTSTAWNVGSNWSCGVPTASSNVVISTAANYPEISSDVTINSLTLDSGTTLKVNSSYDLTVTDIIDNDGTLTIENNANLIQVNDVDNTGSGATVVKRNSSAINRFDYTLWSSPVTGQGLYAFSPLTLSTRFYQYLTATNFYNNSGLGFSISGADPVTGIGGTDTNNVQFATAKGYLIRSPWNHPTAPTVWTGTFSGVPNNGDIPVTVSTAGEPIIGYGYNAVGNPYPSRISVPDFIDGNANISGTLYFWRKTNDNAATSYATLTKTAYVANGALGGDTGTGFFPNGNGAEADWVINVGQGFFVKVNSGSSINFTNGMRRISNSNQFFRNSQTVNTVNNGLYWLNLNANTGIFSQMAVGYSEEGTLDFDRGMDGENINKDFYLTSLINTGEYSVQSRPSFEPTDVVPLSYKVGTAGNYSISIDHSSGLFAEGQLIYLRDNLTSTTHNLATGAYNFSTDAGTFSSRFEIV